MVNYVFHYNFAWKFNYFMPKKREFKCAFVHSKLMLLRASFVVWLVDSWHIYFDPKLCLHNLSDSQRWHNKLILEY